MSEPLPTEVPEAILPDIYPRLRRMAAAQMALEGPGQTLQPTALVHEAWLRLSGGDERYWHNSTHFCSTAAETMRRILIDRARERTRLKRWGGQKRVPLTEANAQPMDFNEKTLLIDAALERLREVDPERARLVVLKFFGGLSNQEIAREMAVAERTVERHWRYAKAWLYNEIREQL